MAKQTAVTDKDLYLETITAQINEIDEQIKAANKKLFDKKAELESIRSHYLKFKKEAAKG